MKWDASSKHVLALVVGIVACAVIGWWFVPEPEAQTAPVSRALAGRVVDALSGESAAARVLVWGPSDAPRAVRPIADDARSEINTSGLAPGRYDVSATTPDGRVGALGGVDLTEASVTDVVVRVAPGAKLALRYIGPHTTASFTVHAGAVVVAAGSIHTQTVVEAWVPAGALSVELTVGPDILETRTLTLTAGETRELAFELR